MKKKSFLFQNTECCFSTLLHFRLFKVVLFLSSGVLDHIQVSTNDGKFSLNQLGQITAKSSNMMSVNMTSFPEVNKQQSTTKLFVVSQWQMYSLLFYCKISTNLIYGRVTPWEIFQRITSACFYCCLTGCVRLPNARYKVSF